MSQSNSEDGKSSLSTSHSSSHHNERCPEGFCSYLYSPESGFNANCDSAYKATPLYVFHTPCETCSEVESEPLCSFCRHFRLRHLVVCPYPGLQRLSAFFQPSLFTRIMTTKNCAFCSILAYAIRSNIYMIHRRTNAEPSKASRLQVKLEINRDPDTSGYGYMCLEFKGRSQGYVVELSISKILGEIATSTANFDKLKLSEEKQSKAQLVQPRVDWNQLQGWISECQQRHQCRSTDFPLSIKGFRLLDNNEQRVAYDFKDKRLGDDVKYVTLSYVWGTQLGQTLTKENAKSLQAPGGLSKVTLPSAIRDALTTCSKLGHRYLWVDQLCIVQDDEENKMQQISAMADIYSSAEFTIINVSGPDMHGPLPGVSEDRKVLQVQSSACGIQFTNVYPQFQHILRHSKWMRRGWTYQEAILSPVKLFFGPYDVWFECDHRNDSFRKEDRFWKTKTAHPSMHFLTRPKFQLRSFTGRGQDDLNISEFTRHLGWYSKRSLTYQTDSLNAFRGVVTKLYGGYNECLYGLPELDFDQAILWFCSQSGIEAKPISHLSPRLMPTWSWASIGKNINIPSPVFRPGFIGTLVHWAYRHNRSNELRGIPPLYSSPLDSSRRISTSSQDMAKEAPQTSPTHLLFAWWAGCIDCPSPKELPKDFKSIGKVRMLELWPDVDQVWKSIHHAQQEQPAIHRDLNIGLRPEDQLTVDELQPGELLTRTQTAFFNLALHASALSSNNYKIISALGEPVGELDLDSPLVGENNRAEKTSRNPIELMALSLQKEKRFHFARKSPDGELGRLIERVFSVKRESDNHGRVTMLAPAVNVLLIGPGRRPASKCRLGAGTISLEAWVSAERAFKTIILE